MSLRSSVVCSSVYIYSSVACYSVYVQVSVFICRIFLFYVTLQLYGSQVTNDVYNVSTLATLLQIYLDLFSNGLKS